LKHHDHRQQTDQAGRQRNKNLFHRAHSDWVL
jgi:hypothetical protein